MPEVSVIIPNYNHAKYLKQRIDSVLNQTFTNFELIILDDCSTDGSRVIIDSYRQQNKVSKIVYNEVNGGNTFLQWKKGIALAQGKYIWIAESDDFADPDFLLKTVSTLNSDENIVLSFSQSHRVDEHGSIIGSMLSIYNNSWTNDFTIEGTALLDEFGVTNLIPNASAVVFKKSSYNNICDDFYYTLRLRGDWLFWIELIRQGKVSYTAAHLNYFRTHTNNVRSKGDLLCWDILEYISVYEHLQQSDPALIDRIRDKYRKELAAKLYVKIIKRFKGERSKNLLQALSKASATFPGIGLQVVLMFLRNIAFRKKTNGVRFF